MTYRSVFAPGLFAGQVVVVTGGGSGIGRCTAHELAALGAHVVLIGRNVDKLRATQDEIVQDGGQASHAVCDIRQEEAVRTTVAAIVQAQGRIDALVNNAGGQYITPAEKIGAKGSIHYQEVALGTAHAILCAESALSGRIIVAFADRYATDQFESYVPLTLGPTQLVASGGIASEVMSRSMTMSS